MALLNIIKFQKLKIVSCGYNRLNALQHPSRVRLEHVESLLDNSNRITNIWGSMVVIHISTQTGALLQCQNQ